MSDKKYQPSNGSEGMWFVEEHCMNCIHEKFSHTHNHADKKCDIFSRTLMYDIKDKEYPSEWTYNEDNKPTCTAWVKWDWGNNDDENGFNEPPVIVPPDPNQLSLFPLHPDERDFEEKKVTKTETVKA